MVVHEVGGVVDEVVRGVVLRQVGSLLWEFRVRWWVRRWVRWWFVGRHL